MAMFAPIPLPDRNKTFQDVMDYLENVQRRRAQQQQFSEEQQRLQQQFGQEFGLRKENQQIQQQQFEKNYQIKKQAEDRVNQLFPYLKQKYQDTHNKEISDQELKDLYIKAYHEALSDDNNNISNGEPSKTGVLTPQGNERLPDVPESKFGFKPSLKNMMGNNLEAPNIPNMPNMQNPSSPDESQNNNQEIVIKKALNPKLEKLDRLAGLKGSPIPKPSISHYQGYTYTQYPSGKITAFKMSPNNGDEPIKMQSQFGKAVADVNYIAKTEGKDSDLYKQGLGYVSRVAQGTPGVELKVDPKSGAVTFTQGASRSKPTQQIVDGKLIQVPSPTTTSSQQGSQLSNVARIGAFKATDNPYVGKDSNAEIMKDYMNIISNKNLSPPEKKSIEDKLVKAAVAAKMVPEIASLQLQSQNVRATVPALKHQRDAIMQGWPISLEWVTNNLPKYLQDRVNKEHTALLSQLNNEKSKFFAQGMPIELGNNNSEGKPSNPDLQAQLDQLDSWAQEAIAMGKNKDLVNKKLQELKNQLKGNQ